MGSRFWVMLLSSWLVPVLFILWMAVALGALAFGRRTNHLWCSQLLGFSCLLLLWLSVAGWGQDVVLYGPSLFSLGTAPVALRLDSLASVFLGLLACVALAVSFFSPGYLAHLNERVNAGHYWAALFIFVLSMTMVTLSANALSFLVFWELMSLSSLALVASDHKAHKVQNAALIYLGATRCATGFLMGGFLWMYVIFHSLDFSQWSFASPSHWAPALMILIGLAIKAGIWPFHIWLPYAHPAAPSPISALMSGVMIKIALYAVIRILAFAGSASPVVSYTAFLLGLISAFWGVLFALVQHDLKRLLAYHSVENVGLILMATALSMHARQFPEVATLALSAAIFHCINHGLFKSLLFLGAGTIDSSVHTRDLIHLGGLAKAMPWTMACFLVGSAAICALPPLNGFASKWLLYQGLFQISSQSLNVFDRAMALGSIGVLALVGALAVACFTKAVGITFLGKARSSAVAEHAREGATGMVAAQVLLAAACAGLGLFAGYVSQLLVPLATMSVVSSPGYAGRALFDLPYGVLLSSSFVTFLLLYGLFLGSSTVRRYITWECGFGSLSSRTQGTAVSFAQPVARIFGPLLKYKLLVEITGRDRRHFPEYIKVEPQMVSILETKVYIPSLNLLRWFSRRFARLQAGSIHLYLLYVCLTLVALLLVGTRL